jgi:hypothetical protein
MSAIIIQAALMSSMAFFSFATFCAIAEMFMCAAQDRAVQTWVWFFAWPFLLCGALASGLAL